jgi:pyruvate/2-oxoglutarate dehydrogenase complex dihydrolipoamide acyltransferase (E2) component
MASKKKIPHAYAVSECDFSLIYHLLEDYKPIFEHQVRFKLTITTFIIYAVIKAIKEFPRVNSLIKENNILEKQYIHLGLAVATERGLIVPVLKKADMKNFSQIGREAYDIIQRGRRNQLRPDDVTDSTFTITNFGIFGNILGFPIINRPNSAILGVGAIKKRPVVVEGSTGDSIGIKPIAYLSLSFDHRIIDGDVGGRFLERIVYYIQSFPRKWIEAGL